MLFVYPAIFHKPFYPKYSVKYPFLLPWSVLTREYYSPKLRNNLLQSLLSLDAD